MQERRQNVRDKVLLGAVAEVREIGATMDCVVRNLSDGGACVELNRSANLPDQINLTIKHKGRCYLARMIWRQANKVGLAFRDIVTDPPAEISTSGFAAARRKSASCNAASTSCWARTEQG